MSMLNAALLVRKGKPTKLSVGFSINMTFRQTFYWHDQRERSILTANLSNITPADSGVSLACSGFPDDHQLDHAILLRALSDDSVTGVYIAAARMPSSSLSFTGRCSIENDFDV
jgi:hypothetical protein